MNSTPVHQDPAWTLPMIPPEHPLNLTIAAEAEKIYLAPSDFSFPNASRGSKKHCLETGSETMQDLAPWSWSEIRDLMGPPMKKHGTVGPSEKIVQVQHPLVQNLPLSPLSLAMSGSSSATSGAIPSPLRLDQELETSMLTFEAISPQEFLDDRVLKINCGLYGFDIVQETVKDSLNRKEISFSQATGLYHIILSWRSHFHRELVIIHRQRKIIEEEMAESISQCNDIEHVYREVLTGKMLRALPYLRATGSLHHETPHARLAGQYYSATRINEAGNEESYCHILGWAPPSLVVACRLVPDALSQDLLSHLFGVGEVPVNDPRNSITLDVHLARALNMGAIAIVPYLSSSEEYEWTIVVVDPTINNHFIYPGVLWKDIHRQPLKFQGDRRPATRYLYFRYVVTYLLYKRRLDPIPDIIQGPKSQDKLWPISGPFLRRSMFAKLALEIGRAPLPEIWYEHTTFDSDRHTRKETNHVQNWTSEEEDVLVLKLAAELLDNEI
ncbi:hypothetical protein McanMca71_005834 [Microsporum canis]|uniref:HNH nuclease domain-containing protein n=1 Tax=Arthroderma otae (strain ATCC MYA-4605 / CBS 113480) TaxID=554155 RepID=C5FBU4_ARTOC|nr:uncharacterized protein MCYG_00166 [Microsporum canis CBS 113480]EEQ27278.1 predicted protein [Microsporum canis CBS 113480]